MAEEHARSVGRQIARLRSKRKLSQRELANLIPATTVDAGFVSKWERGVHLPDKHLPALAKALGVSEGEIMAGTGNGKLRGPTPDLLGQLDGGDADQISDRLSALEGKVDEIHQLSPVLRELSGAVDGLQRELVGLRRDQKATRTKLLAEIAKAQQAPASQRKTPQRRARGS